MKLQYGISFGYWPQYLYKGLINWYLINRVYTNRSVSMDRIKYIGFDMDHTLVGEHWL